MSSFFLMYLSYQKEGNSSNPGQADRRHFDEPPMWISLRFSSKNSCSTNEMDKVIHLISCQNDVIPSSCFKYFLLVDNSFLSRIFQQKIFFIFYMLHNQKSLFFDIWIAWGCSIDSPSINQRNCCLVRERTSEELRGH